ncbi:hypothetical protein EMCRGX_G019763 [Ephydatia muelleri]
MGIRVPLAVDVTLRRKMSKSKHGPAAAFSGASNGRTIAPAKHIQCEETIPSIEPITSPRGISSSSVGPVEVPDLSSSPYRIGASFKLRDNTDISVIKSPSSPMLTAMREAVDSITQYEDFEVVEKIGAGFYADVFKVRYVPTGDIMVLKMNKSKMNGAKKLKEVELLKRLSHPNILHYVGACVHEGQLHPVTEYVSGGTLEQLILNLSVPLPWDLRLQLAQDIAQGMTYLHNRYTAVVSDFGLAAKSIHVYKTLSRAQSLVGNPFWMAPEVINSRAYDEKSDVFAYGIILCELISRREADPDELPRNKDYTVDIEQFKQLPGVRDSSCPAEFMELAFICCNYLPLLRPTFADIRVQLSVVEDLYFRVDHASHIGSVLPQPAKRLSCNLTLPHDAKETLL